MLRLRLRFPATSHVVGEILPVPPTPSLRLAAQLPSADSRPRGSLPG